MDRGERHELDEAALIAAAQADPVAFEALYRRYVARVYRYVRARVDNDDDGVDLTQQVFLQALGALPRYRDRGMPFAAWLFRIARNVAIDAHRRRRVTVTWDLLPEQLHPEARHDPDAMLIQQEAFTRLRELLLSLPADKREMIVLRFVAALTAREIAEVMGKREAAVQKQLSRILRSLKERCDVE
jgi:RNA polymerase sigma-70 factor (ECF subfamily)